MPLAYSNTSAATSALNNVLKPGLTPAAIANAKAKGIGSNLSIATNGQVIAKSPAATVAPKSTTSSGPGAYYGVPITGKTQAEIQAQMAQIDASRAGGGNATGSITAPVAPVGMLSSSMQSTPTNTKTKGGTQAPATPTYSGLVGDLARVGTQGSQQYQQANEALTKFRQNAAEYQGGIYSAPTSAKVMQGRAAAVQAVNAQREAALAAGVSNALSQQQQQISALGTAAGYAQPVMGQIGQVPFNPLDQSQGQVLGAGQQGGIQQAGQLLGQFQGAQAQGAAPGQAAATNTQTAGTVPTTAAGQGYTQAIQQYQSMNTSYGAATAQSSTVKNVLQRTGLNSGNSTDYNKAINTLKGRFSSTDYAQLSTSLAELQNMYTNLLSLSGGTPSGQEAQALSVLNPNSSAAAINASISQLEQAAYNKLNALYQQAQTYQGALQGGAQSGGGGSVSGFGWNG